MKWFLLYFLSVFEVFSSILSLSFIKYLWIYFCVRIVDILGNCVGENILWDPYAMMTFVSISVFQPWCTFVLLQQQSFTPFCSDQRGLSLISLGGYVFLVTYLNIPNFPCPKSESWGDWAVFLCRQVIDMLKHNSTKMLTLHFVKVLDFQQTVDIFLELCDYMVPLSRNQLCSCVEINGSSVHMMDYYQ